jgi:tetratricopeptide (TPR) repeat protein
LYDGEIAYSDSVLANFLNYLKKHGWYDNSIVIVVGDHGEGLGEHHEDTHGIFLYDSTIHVPLIMKLPAGASAAKVLDAQVRTTDILPTVLDLLRIAPPGELDGKSLKPYFAGAETADRTAIGETDYPLRFGWAPLRSVRAEGFKFIEAPRPELYDLHADPGELKNGYEPANATAQKFRGILAQLKPKPSGETASQTDIQGTKSDLQALGYVSGSNAAGANAGASPDPKDKIEEQNLLHAAMLATDDDRPADARTALEKVLQLDPKSPTALRQLGELELRAGDYAQAADHLKRAREVREDSTAAFYEGQAREKIRDLAGARDALEASLKLTPGQLPARLLLGQVYLRLKDPKAAEDQFEAALLVLGDSVEAQLGVAKAQMLENDAKGAIEQLEPLSKAHPENAEILQLLAQAYRALGRLDEAEKADARAQTLREKQAKP